MFATYTQMACKYNMHREKIMNRYGNFKQLSSMVEGYMGVLWDFLLLLCSSKNYFQIKDYTNK